MACLSSRVPHGEPVTLEKLRMIEAAENVLRDLGFYEVRVRHHESSQRSEVGGQKSGGGRLRPFRHLARIELGPAEIPRFLADGISAKVTEALKGIGYAHVTLDLEGYHRGGADALRPKRV
jgi:pyridinium-3,5-biscarboxylic acid mononucleotide sulfurtransferase